MAWRQPQPAQPCAHHLGAYQHVTNLMDWRRPIDIVYLLRTVSTNRPHVVVGWRPQNRAVEIRCRFYHSWWSSGRAFTFPHWRVDDMVKTVISLFLVLFRQVFFLLVILDDPRAEPLTLSPTEHDVATLLFKTSILFAFYHLSRIDRTLFIAVAHLPSLFGLYVQWYILHRVSIPMWLFITAIHLTCRWTEQLIGIWRHLWLRLIYACSDYLLLIMWHWYFALETSWWYTWSWCYITDCLLTFLLHWCMCILLHWHSSWSYTPIYTGSCIDFWHCIVLPHCSCQSLFCPQIDTFWYCYIVDIDDPCSCYHFWYFDDFTTMISDGGTTLLVFGEGLHLISDRTGRWYSIN